jgi:hypothetical protein
VSILQQLHTYIIYLSSSYFVYAFLQPTLQLLKIPEAHGVD